MNRFQYTKNEERTCHVVLILIIYFSVHHYIMSFKSINSILYYLKTKNCFAGLSNKPLMVGMKVFWKNVF